MIATTNPAPAITSARCIFGWTLKGIGLKKSQLEITGGKASCVILARNPDCVCRRVGAGIKLSRETNDSTMEGRQVDEVELYMLFREMLQ